MLSLRDLLLAMANCPHSGAKRSWWCDACGARRDGETWRLPSLVDELGRMLPDEPVTRKDLPLLKDE